MDIESGRKFAEMKFNFLGLYIIPVNSDSAKKE